MVRTIVTPENQDIHLQVPKSYVGKKIEVIAFAIEEGRHRTKKNEDVRLLGYNKRRNCNSITPGSYGKP